MIDTVETLWRYPVKSMMGEQIRTADVTDRGLAGDRAYALVETATNRAAVVRTWGSDLMRYRAGYAEEPRPGEPSPMVEIVTPNGAMLASSQPDVDAHFSAAFGRALRLMTHAPIGLLVEFPPGTLGGKLAKLTEAPLAGRAPAGTFFDLSCILLVATSTIEHLQLDVRRLRPNIVVRTSDAPFIENDWAGRRLAIGERVVLQTSTACPRCINVTLAQDGFLREPSILRAIAGQNLVDLGDKGKLPCVGVYADVVQPGPVAAGDSIRWLD